MAHEAQGIPPCLRPASEAPMALSFSSPLTNNPMLRGSLAAPKQRFGKCGRYAIAPIHTRFNAIEWVIWDADIIDEATGLAVIIRQACTMDEALRGR